MSSGLTFRRGRWCSRVITSLYARTSQNLTLALGLRLGGSASRSRLLRITGGSRIVRPQCRHRRRVETGDPVGGYTVDSDGPPGTPHGHPREHDRAAGRRCRRRAVRGTARVDGPAADKRPVDRRNRIRVPTDAGDRRRAAVEASGIANALRAFLTDRAAAIKRHGRRAVKSGRSMAGLARRAS
jgi:hypothetical protein